MQLKFFGLEREPFGDSPDPAFLFLSATHREALQAMVYGSQHRGALVCVIGGQGLGKTTLARACMDLLDRTSSMPLYASGATVSYDDIREAAFGKPGETRGAVLLLDEAHDLPEALLERLAQLAASSDRRGRALAFVLLGEPGVERLLASGPRGLGHGKTAKVRLRPLTREEGVAYQRSRLRAAAADPECVLTPWAMRRIAKAACGVPGRINAIVNESLEAGFRAGRRPVTWNMVRDGAPGAGHRSLLHLLPWMVAATACLLPGALPSGPWPCGDPAVSARFPRWVVQSPELRHGRAAAMPGIPPGLVPGQRD